MAKSVDFGPNAAKQLRHCLDALLTRLDEADADSWGADVFRRLRSALRAVQLDLEADLYFGSGADQARARLNLLGTELGLQEWADVWPAAQSYSSSIVEVRQAIEAFRSTLHA